MKRKLSLPAVLLFSTLLFCGCAKGGAGNARTNEEIKETRDLFAMDTYISLTAYGEGADTLLSEAENRIYELEKHLSVTDTESEIYAANHSGGMPVKVSKDTEEAAAFALDMAKKTDGALEPTVYPVLTAWGFTTGNYQIPEKQEIESLLQSVDFRKVQADNRLLVLPEGMQIDLGAVAKGYAGDEILELLRNGGIISAIVNLGGNVQTIGSKPDKSKWRIGIKLPNSEEHFGILEVEDCAVITSGNYQKYFTGEDGNTYHHIIDPSTGKPVENGVVSMTVVGKKGRLCDALSTALFVMGKDGAEKYWRSTLGNSIENKQEKVDFQK